MRKRLSSRLYGLLWRWLVRAYPEQDRVVIEGLGEIKHMYEKAGDLVIVVDGKGELDGTL